MEIEDLKTIWQNTRGFQSKDETEIASMLKGTSKSVVNSLKRNVWFEMIFTLAAGIALLIYAITLKSGALKWISVSILFLFVAYSFYYAKKISMLNRFDPWKGNLKMSLEMLINNLTGYLRFYKRSYTILYPVYFCLGLLFSAVERGTDEFIRILNKPEVIAYLVGVMLVFFVCSRWLTNWYLNKLYGNHLNKLKDLLTDLSSTSIASSEFTV